MQKEIQLTDKTLFVVGLKYPLSKYDIKHEYLRGFDNYGVYDTMKLPQGDWQLLSTSKEMTEEKAKMIMPTLSKEGYEYIYQDFINTENWFNTSLEAFHSFMYSIGMPCHNPYGKEKPTYETVNILEYFKYRKELYAWQEAEAKLVNSVILYKEK